MEPTENMGSTEDTESTERKEGKEGKEGKSLSWVRSPASSVDDVSRETC